MSKRKLVVLGVVVLWGTAFCILLGWPDSNTDAAHRHNLQRYRDLYFRLQDLEHRLGGDVARAIGVQALERNYGRKADAEREALLASGYFVKVHAVVTNLESRTGEVNARLRNMRYHGSEGLVIFDTRSNCVTVICRPQYAPLYREELQK